MSMPIMAVTPAVPVTPLSQPITLRMGYEEWLHWEHHGIAEWIQGEVIQMATTDDHQMILGFLHVLMSMFVKIFKLGLVRLAPYPMLIAPCANGREPDLIFVENENLAHMIDEQLNGPADLVIEVISEGSVYNDRVDKFQEYEEGGVTEYWLIDSRPKRQRADFYVLDEQGHYQPVPIGKDGIYHSTVLPNFWLRVSWLWETEPDALVALDELVGTETIVAAMRARKHQN